MTSIPSATTWGSPTATKHALLIHGLSSSSHTWHRVAISLAAQGYFVTAPNLVGHLFRPAADYRISAVAEDLRPYLAARDYSLIIGHSLAGPVILSMFSRLPPSRPIAIVLVDPPLRVPQEVVQAADREFMDTCTNIKGADVLKTENPLWTHEDGVYRELATRTCSIEAVHGLLERNTPWDFLDYLNTIAELWRVTVLVADPAIYQVCKVNDLAQFPRVRSVVVSGASHWIQNEFPDVVVDEAMKTIEWLDES